MTAHKPSSILRAALAIVPDASRWTTGAMARDVDGRSVAHTNPRAVRFSVVAALQLAGGSQFGMNPVLSTHCVGVRRFVRLAIWDELNATYCDLSLWEDSPGRKYEDVANMLRAAEKLASNGGE